MRAKQHLKMLALLGLVLGVVPAQAETIEVTIDKFVYTPATITATIGDTIEWINKDPVDHTATVKDDWEVMLPAQKTTSQVLETAEAVDFYCRFHPNMTGKLTVTAR